MLNFVRGNFYAVITDSKEMTGNQGERNVSKVPAEFIPGMLLLMVSILTLKFQGYPEGYHIKGLIPLPRFVLLSPHLAEASHADMHFSYSRG